MEQALKAQNFCAGHLVQFYKNSDYLAESVAEYVRLGLAKGDGILVLASREHWHSLKQALMDEEQTLEYYLSEQRVLYVDAELALEQVMHHGRPNKKAFVKLISSILQRMHTYPNLRAYGELVDLLCADGKVDEAIELEQYWNEILQENPQLSLMCGYKADHLGESIQSICQLHSHTIQVENISQLDDEEALYRRIAILEQKYAALKHNNEKLNIEHELLSIKKRLTQSGKLSILGELCAGIAHEFNNPLAIILGCTKHSREVVSRSAQPLPPILEDILKRMEYIDDASNRMSKIIHNVMMFAKQQEHSFACFDVRSTLEKALEFMKNSLRLEQIQVNLMLPTESFFSMGDAELIQQAFVNIMSNARDALASTTTEAGRCLFISAQCVHDQQIEISFQDSGIGMDEQTLGKIFYPFFTTKAIGKGIGLGLAISHGIITQHKGEIYCESKPGQGTLVRVILPQLAEASAALRA